jgi:TetR/AcrR family transcriptional regulator
MGGDAERIESVDQAARTEQVHFDGGVEGGVERNARGGVHDDVAGGQKGAALVVEPKAVYTDIAGDRGDPATHLGGEPVAQLGPEPVESVIAQHLAAQAFLNGGAAARTNEKHQLTAGNSMQEALHERGAEEARGASDGDAFTRQLLCDHPITPSPTGRSWAITASLSTIWSVSTRERILDGALKAYAERGFEATSLDALAADVGVKKQTILYWFLSKDALLEALIERSAGDLAGVLEGALVADTKGFERVEAIVRSVFRLAGRRPELLGLVREVSRLGPPAATQLMARLDPLMQRATAFLASEMDAGAFRRQDPRLLLLSTYSTVVGVATEVEVLRGLGIEATARSLAMRRRELLNFLRSALAARA